MPAKPHRVLLDRVSGYADEAAAYLRRRRNLRRPFARVHYAGGRSASFPSDSDEGKALFSAAAGVIEIAGPPRREAKLARAGAPQSRASAKPAGPDSMTTGPDSK